MPRLSTLAGGAAPKPLGIVLSRIIAFDQAAEKELVCRPHARRRQRAVPVPSKIESSWLISSSMLSELP